MLETELPRIWSLAEVAEYFKVSEEVVLRELEEGNLQGFKLGNEWRCTQTALLTYIGRSSARAHLNQLQPAVGFEVETTSEFTEIGPFDFAWPKTGGGQHHEHYSVGYETTRQVNGHLHTFRIGIGEREVAGQLRARFTVWLDNRAIVEFAGGNSYESNGLVASVIKLPNGRQLPPHRKLPAEYVSFHVETYNSVVSGPYASKNLAIVVHRDDLESMVRHAIIRAQWKGLI